MTLDRVTTNERTTMAVYHLTREDEANIVAAIGLAAPQCADASSLLTTLDKINRTAAQRLRVSLYNCASGYVNRPLGV